MRNSEMTRTPTHPECEAEPRAAAAAPTPDSVTRGLKSAPALVTAAVDWVSVTLKDVPDAVSHTDLLEWATDALGITEGDWVQAEHGMYGYNEMLLGPGGAKYLSSGWLDHAHVILPGEACRQAGQERLIKYLSLALDFGNVRRVDLAADDHDRTMTPSSVREAIARGEAVTRAKTCQTIASVALHPFDEGVQEPLGGDTLYIGGFKSSRLLRVYDKEVESGGEIKAVRWELQWRDEFAVLLARDIVLGGAAGLGETWASHARAFCDWRERDVIETEERAIAGWWLRLVTAARKALPLPRRPARTLAQVKDWVERISPSLAVLFHAQGGDMTWWAGLMDAGRTRWHPHHLAMAGSTA